MFDPKSDQDYEQLVTWLNALIDHVGGDENHPLASLMEVIGTLMEKYEAEHDPEWLEE